MDVLSEYCLWGLALRTRMLMGDLVVHILSLLALPGGARLVLLGEDV